MNSKIFLKCKVYFQQIVNQKRKIRIIFQLHKYKIEASMPYVLLLLSRTLWSILKVGIWVLIINWIEYLVINNGVVLQFDLNILSEIIIAGVGVSGVILGLYCSNILGVYSTKYINASKLVAKSFQADKLTLKCLNTIIGFIIYGTLLLVEMMIGIKVGVLSVVVLILWSIVVIVAYGIAGNRSYQLADVFKVSDDAFDLLNRLISCDLKGTILSSDKQYERLISETAVGIIAFLRELQNYGCSLRDCSSSSLLYFMSRNIDVLNNYWEIKKNISKKSAWFREKGRYQKWHTANALEAAIALETGTSLLPKNEPDYYWFENELTLINHSCINYLIERNDWDVLYRYFTKLEELCGTAIFNKEANYYVEEINWISNVIEKKVDINLKENVDFKGIVEQVSILYLSLILGGARYLEKFDIDKISEIIIDTIDSGIDISNINEISGRYDFDVYKKISAEIEVEGHRITPIWKIKQFVAKEEYVYINSFPDMIREGVDKVYKLGKMFIDKKMFFEGYILFIRFYEYESKILTFCEVAEDKEKVLQELHIDFNDEWDKSRLINLYNDFCKYKRNLPEQLLNCSSEFTFGDRDSKLEYPDFLGECFNHIAEDSIRAIVNNDQKQFELDFQNLTKLMLLYAESIRTDADLSSKFFRVETLYYMFTAPIVEWAQIGGLGILWGEFFKDDKWQSIVKKASDGILINEENREPRELAERLIEYIQNRDKFMIGINGKTIIETGRIQAVSNAINNTLDENSKLKIKSKLIKSFCPTFYRLGFMADPSEVFWVICVNPLLTSDKRFKTKYGWEDKISEE